MKLIDTETQFDNTNKLSQNWAVSSSTALPVLWYFTKNEGSFPHISYTYLFLLYDDVIKYLNENYPDCKIIFQRKNQTGIDSIYIKLKDGIWIQFNTITYQSKTKIRYFDENKKDEKPEPNIYQGPFDKYFTIIEGFYVLYTSSYEKESDKIIQDVSKFHVRSDNDHVSLGIVNSGQNGYFIRHINIGKNIGDWQDLDLHYPSGNKKDKPFSEFYKKLCDKILENQKGLYLFYGDPGTGKTHMIRHIIKDILQIKNSRNVKKSFLYIPTNIIAYIMEPSFLTFLTEHVSQHDAEVVLILEDAEKVLMKRKGDSNSDGVANILNLSDGLLNDILGFEIIATFNTSIENIDDALLRDGRLIARKKFEKLSPDEANILLKKLEINIETDKKMSLSEIYSLKNKCSVIEHNMEQIKEDAFIL